MNESLLAAAGTLISLGNTIVLIVLAVKVGRWTGIVDTRLANRDERDEERHGETRERLDRIEKKVGISNGGATFVDREFCREVHRSFTAEAGSLKESQTALTERVQKAIDEGREAIRIGHEDRMAIKARLVRVEEALTNR